MPPPKEEPGSNGLQRQGSLQPNTVMQVRGTGYTLQLNTVMQVRGTGYTLQLKTVMQVRGIGYTLCMLYSALQPETVGQVRGTDAMPAATGL